MVNGIEERHHGGIRRVTAKDPPLNIGPNESSGVGGIMLVNRGVERDLFSRRRANVVDGDIGPADEVSELGG